MTSRDYLFVVDGELSDRGARAFEGMRVNRDGGTTTIETRCRDQAELLGTLMRISHLGLTLVSLTSRDSGTSRPPGPPSTAPSSPTASLTGVLAPDRSARVSSQGSTDARET